MRIELFVELRSIFFSFIISKNVEDYFQIQKRKVKIKNGRICCFTAFGKRRDTKKLLLLRQKILYTSISLHKIEDNKK